MRVGGRDEAVEIAGAARASHRDPAVSFNCRRTAAILAASPSPPRMRFSLSTGIASPAPRAKAIGKD